MSVKCEGGVGEDCEQDGKKVVRWRHYVEHLNSKSMDLNWVEVVHFIVNFHMHLPKHTHHASLEQSNILNEFLP